jgi:hypothetical protein
MERISFSWLLLACVLLSACGTSSPNTPSKRKDTTPAPPPPQKQCPTTPPAHAQLVTLNFTRVLPLKMALKLDGDPDFRLSDCADKSQSGVKASWERATNLQLKVLVDHGGAFNGKLPAAQGLEVFDLGADCKLNPPASFYKTEAPLPINWRIENPIQGCPQTRAIGAASNNSF